MLRDAAINPLPDGSSNRILLADMLKLPGFKSGSKSPWWWIPEDDPPVTGVDGIPLSLPKQSSLFVKEKKKRLEKDHAGFGANSQQQMANLSGDFCICEGWKMPWKNPQKTFGRRVVGTHMFLSCALRLPSPSLHIWGRRRRPWRKVHYATFFSDKSVVSLPKRSKPIKLKCSSNWNDLGRDFLLFFCFPMIFDDPTRPPSTKHPSIIPSLLLGRSPVALASVLEPIGDLGQRQSGLFGQRALLVGRRVSVLPVAIFEGGARFLFEAVNRFFSVPDRLRQRILAPQTVLVHSSQCPVPHLFSFLITIQKWNEIIKSLQDVLAQNNRRRRKWAATRHLFLVWKEGGRFKCH